MQFLGELSEATVLEIDDEAVLELHGQTGAIRIVIPEIKGPALVHIAEDCRRVYDDSLFTDGGNEERWQYRCIECGEEFEASPGAGYCPHCARHSIQRRSV